MPVYLLTDEPMFPPALEAEPDGLIAIGGDFSPERLVNAYASGIFPWFEHDGEIYWFSPDPRLVLFPGKLKVSLSLSRTIRRGRFEIRFDQNFRAVMEQCAQVPRTRDEGTWISDRFIEGYEMLHRMGLARSVETYLDGVLVGGLYGVALGKAFFGESMFHLVPDASKVAFVVLVRKLMEQGTLLIDCQVETEHLKRFGAELLPRREYLRLLKEAVNQSPASSVSPSG